MFTCYLGYCKVEASRTVSSKSRMRLETSIITSRPLVPRFVPISPYRPRGPSRFLETSRGGGARDTAAAPYNRPPAIESIPRRVTGDFRARQTRSPRRRVSRNRGAPVGGWGRRQAGAYYALVRAPPQLRKRVPSRDAPPPARGGREQKRRAGGEMLRGRTRGFRARGL